MPSHWHPFHWVGAVQHVPDESAWIAASELQEAFRGIFPTYRKLRYFLDAHRETIRQNQRPRRRKIHAGDFARALLDDVLKGVRSLNLPGNVEIDFFERYAEIRAKKDAEHGR